MSVRSSESVDDSVLSLEADTEPELSREPLREPVRRSVRSRRADTSMDSDGVLRERLINLNRRKSGAL